MVDLETVGWFLQNRVLIKRVPAGPASLVSIWATCCSLLDCKGPIQAVVQVMTCLQHWLQGR